MKTGEIEGGALRPICTLADLYNVLDASHSETLTLRLVLAATVIVSAEKFDWVAVRQRSKREEREGRNCQRGIHDEHSDL